MVNSNAKNRPSPTANGIDDMPLHLAFSVLIIVGALIIFVLVTGIAP